MGIPSTPWELELPNPVRALIVYESMFGNTEAIARAVAEGIGVHAGVTVVQVGAAPVIVGPDIGLLVVGGPTHAFGLSRAGTRASAVQQGAAPVTPADRGLREWLDSVAVLGTGTLAAAFDTRVLRTHLPGSAARAALRRLRRLGPVPIAGATSFAVDGTAGPLADGELARARAWGEALGANALARSVPSPAHTVH
jgi:hypothetical protein